jgi:hypothetical protein
MRETEAAPTGCSGGGGWVWRGEILPRILDRVGYRRLTADRS